MKNNRFLILTMALLILLSSSISVFAKDKSSDRDDGWDDGWDKGYLDGRREASRNTSDKADKDKTDEDKEDKDKEDEDKKDKDKDKEDKSYKDVILTEKEIDNKYRDILKGQSTTYKLNFYDGYREGFKEGYNDKKDPEETKTDYADSLGTLLGEIYGYRDYYNGDRSNWSKAYPSTSSISNMFDLRNQTSSYKSSFYSKFKEAFQKSYETAYEKANLEPEKVTLEAGTSDGETVATVLGSIYGAKDFFENSTNSYTRNMPGDSIIIRDYSLNKDKTEYKEGFLIGFRRAYEESYNTSYRENNINATMGSTEAAYEDGKTAGEAKGQVQANHDYMGERENNWKNNKIFSSQIIAEYNLVYQSKEYRDGFIAGFSEGFTNGYNETYNTLNQKYVVEKSVVDIIPKAGGGLTTGDGELSIEIEKGTFYNDVSLSIETLTDSNYSKDSRYIKASNLYNIEITNKSGAIDKDKKIKLSFDYFDDYRGGVYKKIGNKMEYINSYIEDDKIIAEVHPNTLTSTNNIYCVLVDKKVTIFPDARSNWANHEIDTLVRRNVIYGYDDGYFKPELNVTRGEFLTLLSRVYDWNLNHNIGVENFKDYNKFGKRDKIIGYALNNGYINGYSDNTFRPNSPISYKEVEIIMARLLDDPSFKWYNTAANMMYERQRKSSSYNSINNNAKRSEIVYMLYILNEWRY